MVTRRPAVLAVRNDLGGHVVVENGETLFSLVHISDMHVLDAASPARAEWVELEGHDPLWRPLLHLHRPYDTLTAFALHAHVEAIANDPVGPVTGRPFDIVVSSGDNIDNAQRNELDAYLAIVAGGVTRLDAHGSAQDADADPAIRPWPYWSPDPSVPDMWRAVGYPVVDDLIERASAPVASRGLGIDWTSVPGNHDLMRQGTALPNPAIDAIAVAPVKSLRRPAGFTPADPLDLYLDHPQDFSVGKGFAIDASAARRSIDRGEWIEGHIAAGALGYTAANLESGSIDTVIDFEHVRLILLDTNHPAGDYEGSVGVNQLAWLEDRLAEVDRATASGSTRRLAILVSHHGADTLVNERGHDPARRLASELTDVVHRHACVVAWLVGHRHINRIEPRRGAAGGFWEITTSSTIDWPSQTRAIELVRHDDGSVELLCTMIDHDDSADGLATLHRQLAHRFATTGVATRMSGREGDGDVRLLLPPR
jgi:metallophosphoesterase (TIGR03767 family)